MTAGVVVGLVIGALLMAMVPVMAGNGDPILMGEKNKAIRSTWVASRGPSVLRISNTLNGTAVELKTAAHVPPMIVNSSAKVAGLNVDLLDGLDSTAFAAAGHDHDAAYSASGHNHDAAYSALGHSHSGEFAAAGHDHDADYLGIAAKAADSDLFDGQDSTAFAAAAHNHDASYATVGHNHTGVYLPAGGTAANSNLLQGQPASAFAAASHGHSLDSATNVNITGVGNGELLQYQSGNWINRTLGEAGVASTGHAHTGVYLPLAGKAADADKLDNMDSSAFATAGHNHSGVYLPVGGTAANSNLLQGSPASAFATAGHGHTFASLSDTTVSSPGTGEVLRFMGGKWINQTYTEAGISPSGHNHSGLYLPAAGTAVNADKLDNLDSSAFALAAHNHDGSYISLISSPASGKFPTMTSGGELQSSGWSAASFASAGHSHSGVYLPVGGTAANANLLDGHDSSYFLSTSSTAANANLLDGHDSSYFATASGLASHNHSGVYLPVGGTAANSDKVDGKHANELVRSAGVSTTNGNDSGTVTSTTIVAPTNGYLLINGTFEAYRSAAGTGTTACSLAVNTSPITPSSRSVTVATLEYGTCATNAYFPVAGGSHTVYLINSGSGFAVNEASLNILYVPFDYNG